jgi:hypothetical protein
MQTGAGEIAAGEEIAFGSPFPVARGKVESGGFEMLQFLD